jgi:hypothetical protein
MAERVEGSPNRRGTSCVPGFGMLCALYFARTLRTRMLRNTWGHNLPEKGTRSVPLRRAYFRSTIGIEISTGSNPPLRMECTMFGARCSRVLDTFFANSSGKR